MTCWKNLGLGATPKALNALTRMDGLTPGDFGNLMLLAEPQPIPDAWAFVELLRGELALKPGGTKRDIGLSTGHSRS